MAIPKPVPRDWQLANARELQVTDREVLALLRASKKRVDEILKSLPQGKQEIRRAQLEQSRAALLAEQADVFERLGDLVSARRARAASRSARLSAAADAALLSLVGRDAQGQYLYETAKEVSQRAIDAALARMRFSEVPLSQRIYRTGVWMGGRLSKLINETLASGLNAGEFAKRARDWFNPNTPGGVRYAAMRLARTEINNAFHSMSAAKYADTPWITEVEWNLSKSHPKPDICNKVHADSPYPADRVPARPHPQCMCYITPKPVDEDEFIDRFIAGEYDDYLDAELDRNGWDDTDSQPVAAPPSLDAGTQRSEPLPEVRTPVRAEALTGEAAHASVPKGLFKRGTMTPQQRKSLQTYETGWFMVIQDVLRRKRMDDPDKADEVKHIANIDAAMDESILPQPIQTWRALFMSELLFGDRLKSDLTGFTWEELGYSSTTTNEAMTRVFMTGQPDNLNAKPVDNSVKMVVRVASGVKALETSTSTKGSKTNGPQSEITLQRDLVWKVVKDNGIDPEGVRHLEVEVDIKR